MNIELGDKVKCKYSGFEGIVVGKHYYINGCTQYTICPKCKDKNEPAKEESIDEQSLVIVSKHNPVIKEEIGGPSRNVRQRGF